MLKKIVNIEFIFVHRVVEFPDRARDLGREEQKQHDVGDVHLPDACPQPLEGSEEIPGADDRTIDVAGQITGNEHEEFGGIAEAVIAQRQPGNEVVRNVIEENHPQPYAAEQIEPEVTLNRKRERCDILICHTACPFGSVSGRVWVLPVRSNKTPRGQVMVIALHHAKAGRYAEKDRNQSPYSFAKIANWSNSAKSTPPAEIIKIRRRRNYRFGAWTNDGSKNQMG